MGSKNPFYMDIQTLNSSVTGSCHLCIVKYPDRTSSRFIVDCGLFQGREETNGENRTFTFTESSIEFALVTHNHVDHIGRLPLLYKNGFRGNIYTSLPTSVLLKPALYDSFHVLNDTAKRQHTTVLYGDSGVVGALKLVKGVPFGEQITIDEHIKVTFFQNGHLIGAALILVEISYPGEQNIHWLFTGDYNNKNIFLDIPALPKHVLEMPLNIMVESTYGDKYSQDIVPCFEHNILEAFATNSNATIVIPVFSLGRSQEILYFLKNLQDQGKLDCAIPIFFDGRLAKLYTELYLKGVLGIKENMLDFLPYNMQYVDSSNRDMILADDNAKIILTSSGMGSYGPAPLYISNFIRRKNALIHFTGYTAEGTLGYFLRTTPIGEVVKVGGVLAKKQARVEYTSEFSAHAKADELIGFLQQFTNLNLILVNHGNLDVKETFATQVVSEVQSKDVGIACREIFFRVSPYRLIKTMDTKFQ